jgi:tRNA threonylcarbamoyladenosine biosynthesis protein TsaB
MKILAVDTTGGSASVAIVQEKAVLAEIFFDLGRNHSEILLPAIEHILKTACLELSSMDAFACTVGPGSFTGIRIGVSTVKGLALALDRPVVAVSALESLAMNAAGLEMQICPMIDARREQVYAALYADKDSDSLGSVIPETLSGVDDFLERIEGNALFMGTGALKYGDIIRRKMAERGTIAAHHLHRVHASAAGMLAVKKALEGNVTDAVRIVPLYLRRSEAEEKKIASVDMEVKFS